MPKTLTAEGGHKRLLIGDYFESIDLDCAECEGEPGDEGCMDCGGDGVTHHRVLIQWTTMKDIYNEIVEFEKSKQAK